MSEIYNLYETSFKALSKNIDSKLNKNEYDFTSTQKLRNEIQEINRLLKQMKLEIENLKISNNKIPKEIEENLKIYEYKIKEYNNQLILIQNKNNINIGNKKEILIDDDENKEMGLIEDDYSPQKKINKIQKDISNIEYMGYNIGNNLNEQNEQIKYIQHNVDLMNIDAENANDLINKAINQARRNKIIFNILLILLFIVFIALMIIKKNNNNK